MANNVKITVDAGDAEATYKFLRTTVDRILTLTKDMDPEVRKTYFDQSDRYDNVAIALGEAVGEVDLPTLRSLEKIND